VSTTARIMILGLGNAWRGDDGVGPYVAGALAGLASPEVSVLASVPDALSLIDAWQGAQQVYVIDAVQSGAREGDIVRLDALRDPLPTASAYSSHGLGLPEAVALARQLRRLPDRLTLIGIEAHCLAPGQTLCAAVREAGDKVLEQLRRECFNVGSRSRDELPRCSPPNPNGEHPHA
jgi:hydrogenase maturation protease